MAITFTEKSGTYDNTDATSYATASLTAAASKLYIIDIYVSGTNPVVTAVAFTTGAAHAWTKEKEDNGAGKAISRWRYLNASPNAASTVTITVGSGTGINGCAWTITEVDGMDTSGTNGSGAFVQSTNAAATATSGKSDLAAYTGSASRPIATIGINANTTITPELTGATQRSGTGPAQAHLTQWSTSTQDTTPNFTWSGSNAYRAISSEIKAASVPITISPAAATASAAGIVPAIKATVSPAAATATAAGIVPTIVIGPVVISAPTAAATALANVPVVSVALAPAAATATALANVPVISIRIAPAAATASALANVPTLVNTTPAGSESWGFIPLGF